MRSCKAALRYFTRSLKTIGAIKAARVWVLRRAERTALPVKAMRAPVKIARGISHAIAVAKWKVTKRERFSETSPFGKYDSWVFEPKAQGQNCKSINTPKNPDAKMPKKTSKRISLTPRVFLGNDPASKPIQAAPATSWPLSNHSDTLASPEPSPGPILKTKSSLFSYLTACTPTKTTGNSATSTSAPTSNMWCTKR